MCVGMVGDSKPLQERLYSFVSESPGALLKFLAHTLGTHWNIFRYSITVATVPIMAACWRVRSYILLDFETRLHEPGL